jgi:nitrite reductase/ring-hydroxylating ferredoxin subunit
MERREFLRSACTLCLLATPAVYAVTLPSCASIPIYETAVRDSRLRVPVDLLSQQPVRVVRGTGLEYDIALERRTDGSYRAFLMECTHAHNPLTFTGADFVCPLHGSRFDENGEVTHGPASLPLTELKTQNEGTAVAIVLK